MRWLFLPVLLQTQASVGLGVGTVRYAGGSSLAVAAVSPGLHFVSATSESSGSGTVAPLAHGGWAASVEPTHFLGAWFTDVNASVTADRGRLSATAASVLRTSATYASSAAASALVQFHVSPAAALEVGGGSYLRDPYQGFPRAAFVTAAIRLVRPPRAAASAAEPTWPPLLPQAHGDTVTVRFSMPGAGAVAIAGDWNDWAPLPLRPLAGDQWVGDLTLRPGTYHFNLLVDGREWVVPRGVATVPDGLGGIVGVLIVN